MNSPRIYLDHAATSWPKPVEVVREMSRAMTDLVANAGRSGHQASLEAARTVFDARKRFALLLGASRPEDVVFVRGGTEGLNLVLKGWLKPGDRVAVSPMEHNAVMRPLTRLVRERGVIVQTLPADRWGRIDLEAARREARSRRFALAAVSHASNVNGVVQDLAGVRDAFGDVPLLVDAAQTAGVLPIHVENGRIDFLACSAHKGLLGPTGVGVCYVSGDRDITPLLEGGTGSRSESQEQPEFRPDLFEAGTLNVHGIAGACGALAVIQRQGLLGPHKRHLSKILADGLGNIPKVRIYSPSDGAALCVSFAADHLHPDEVAARLEREHGMLCRPGLHCSPAAHRHLGSFPAGTVRLSPGWGNTVEHIESAVRAVRAIVLSG